MIQSIKATAAGEPAAQISMAKVFRYMGFTGDAYETLRAARAQLRLQLSWPRLLVELTGRGIDRQIAYDEFGSASPAAFRLEPVYQRLTTPAREYSRVCEERIQIALIFAPENAGIEMAHVYAIDQPALGLLIQQFLQRQHPYRIEFPWVPVESYLATPERQAIYEYRRGRLYPGPDLVRAAQGERLSDILNRVKTPAISRSAVN